MWVCLPSAWFLSFFLFSFFFSFFSSPFLGQSWYKLYDLLAQNRLVVEKKQTLDPMEMDQELCGSSLEEQNEEENLLEQGYEHMRFQYDYIEARVVIYDNEDNYGQMVGSSLKYLFHWKDPENTATSRDSAYTWEPREIYKEVKNEAGGPKHLHRPKKWENFYIIQDSGKNNLKEHHLKIHGLEEELRNFSLTPEQEEELQKNYALVAGEDQIKIWLEEAKRLAKEQAEEKEEAAAAAAVAAAVAAIVQGDVAVAAMLDSQILDHGGGGGGGDNQDGDNILPQEELGTIPMVVDVYTSPKKRLGDLDVAMTPGNNDNNAPVSKRGKSSSSKTESWFQTSLNEAGVTIEAIKAALATLYQNIEASARFHIEQRIEGWATKKQVVVRYDLLLEFEPPLDQVQMAAGFRQSDSLTVKATLKLLETGNVRKAGSIDVKPESFSKFGGIDGMCVGNVEQVSSVFQKLLKSVASILSKEHGKLPTLEIVGNNNSNVAFPKAPAVAIVSGTFAGKSYSRQGGATHSKPWYLVQAIRTSIMKYLVMLDTPDARRKNRGGYADLNIRSNFAVEPARAISILIKMVPILEICPLISLLDLDITESSGSSSVVDYVVIRWNVAKLEACFLEDFISMGQRTLNMVMEDFRIAKGSLKKGGRSQGADGTHQLTVIPAVSTLRAIASKGSRRAKPGEPVAASSLYKPLACFINFLRYVSFAEGASHLSPTLIAFLSSALRTLEASGKMWLNRAELLSNTFRKAMVEDQAEHLFQLAVRLKTLVKDASPLLLEPLISYLFQGVIMDQQGIIADDNDGRDWYKEEGSSCILAQRREQLFGEKLHPKKAMLLLSHLRGFLCCGISLLFGGHRPQVYRELVLLPPCVTLNDVDMSLVADKIVSGLVCIQGVFHLVISNDKVASSKGLEKYELPGALSLVCAILFQWREYVLQRVLRKKDLELRLKDLKGNVIEDASWPVLCLPLFLSEVRKEKGSSTTIWHNIKDNPVVFEDLKDVLEHGFCRADYFVGAAASTCAGGGGGDDDDDDDDDDDAPLVGGSLVRPYQFVLLPFFASFTSLRVALSNYQGLYLKQDPRLFQDVVEMVRHGKQVVRDVYAPGVVNLQHEETAKRFGATMGFGADQWTTPLFCDRLYREAMRQPLPVIPSEIQFAAQQLMLLKVQNFFHRSPEGTVVLSTQSAAEPNLLQSAAGGVGGEMILLENSKSLKSIITDISDIFNLWVYENSQDIATAKGMVSFPYFLTLGGIPCIQDKMWPMIPFCSCCKRSVKLENTSEDAIDDSGRSVGPTIDSERYPVAAQILEVKSNWKFMYCDNHFNCSKFQYDCSCSSNRAFLLTMQRTVQYKFPYELAENIQNEIFQ
jgi:hypothetical protein